MYDTEDKVYCYPGTNVLINHFGIKDPAKLEAFEGDITALRLKELIQNPIAGSFDLKHLRDIHRYIFQDIYPWAGELRTVRISKGIMFAYPENIEAQGNSYFNMLKEEKYLANMPFAIFCERLAYYKSEIKSVCYNMNFG